MTSRDRRASRRRSTTERLRSKPASRIPIPDSRRVTLERALSKLGIASRSHARTLIEGGRVAVEGRPVTDPLARVIPETVHLAIDGEAAARAPWRTILCHKPRGIVTTTRDPAGRPTVYDVLGDAATGLMPVGRLDLASTGLLIFTNDTQLAAWLTDPAHAVPRSYVVTARGEVTDGDVASTERGIDVNGETLRALHVEVRKRSRRETHLIVTLDEGRNRQIRRLFAALGHEVTRLKRVSIGGLVLGNLAPGQWRTLSRQEIAAAFPDRFRDSGFGIRDSITRRR